MNNSKNMMNGDKEDELIEAVQKEGREFLYKTNDKNYKNNAMKRIVWAEIGEEMGSTSETCMKRWKLLRAKYSKAVRQPKSGSAGTSKKNDPLIRKLDFLRDQLDEPTESSMTFEQCTSENVCKDLSDKGTNASLFDITVDEGEYVFTAVEEPPPSPPPIPPQRKQRKLGNPIDPMVKEVMKNMEENRRMVRKLQTEPCLLTTFAQTVSSDFRTWPITEQTKFVNDLSHIYEARENFLKDHNMI